jgi:hypothetical protein
MENEQDIEKNSQNPLSGSIGGTISSLVTGDLSQTPFEDDEVVKTREQSLYTQENPGLTDEQKNSFHSQIVPLINDIPKDEIEDITCLGEITKLITGETLTEEIEDEIVNLVDQINDPELFKKVALIVSKYLRPDYFTSIRDDILSEIRKCTDKDDKAKRLLDTRSRSSLYPQTVYTTEDLINNRRLCRIVSNSIETAIPVAINTLVYNIQHLVDEANNLQELEYIYKQLFYSFIDKDKMLGLVISELEYIFDEVELRLSYNNPQLFSKGINLKQESEYIKEYPLRLIPSNDVLTRMIKDGLKKYNLNPPKIDFKNYIDLLFTSKPELAKFLDTYIDIFLISEIFEKGINHKNHNNHSSAYIRQSLSEFANASLDKNETTVDDDFIKMLFLDLVKEKRFYFNLAGVGSESISSDIKSGKVGIFQRMFLNDLKDHITQRAAKTAPEMLRDRIKKFTETNSVKYPYPPTQEQINQYISILSRVDGLGAECNNAIFDYLSRKTYQIAKDLQKQHLGLEFKNAFISEYRQVVGELFEFMRCEKLSFDPQAARIILALENFYNQIRTAGDDSGNSEEIKIIIENGIKEKIIDLQNTLVMDKSATGYYLRVFKKISTEAKELELRKGLLKKTEIEEVKMQEAVEVIQGNFILGALNSAADWSSIITGLKKGTFALFYIKYFHKKPKEKPFVSQLIKLRDGQDDLDNDTTGVIAQLAISGQYARAENDIPLIAKAAAIEAAAENIANEDENTRLARIKEVVLEKLIAETGKIKAAITLIVTKEDKKILEETVADQTKILALETKTKIDAMIDPAVDFAVNKVTKEVNTILKEQVTDEEHDYKLMQEFYDMYGQSTTVRGSSSEQEKNINLDRDSDNTGIMVMITIEAQEDVAQRELPIFAKAAAIEAAAKNIPKENGNKRLARIKIAAQRAVSSQATEIINKIDTEVAIENNKTLKEEVKNSIKETAIRTKTKISEMIKPTVERVVDEVIEEELERKLKELDQYFE